MKLMNDRNYDPLDDASATGYRRPPRDPTCICDYFAALGGSEDDGMLLHAEMQALLDWPDEFFAPQPPATDPPQDDGAASPPTTKSRPDRMPCKKVLELAARAPVALQVAIADAAGQSIDRLHVRLEPSERGIDVYFEGYGTADMQDGYGAPMWIELSQGHPRVLLWGDINEEDPTHDISLARARESLRQENS